MRIGPLVILAGSLLASPCPAGTRAAAAPISRVENRTYQAWKLSMGNLVAGMVRIREAGGSAELASLKGEGESYFLMPGKAVDMEVLAVHDCLALQVTFSMPAGTGSGASVFISQGKPGDPHTLNLNPSPTVHMDRTCYGRARKGAFVLID